MIIFAINKLRKNFNPPFEIETECGKIVKFVSRISAILSQTSTNYLLISVFHILAGAFYSRLNSLKMSEKIVKRVFVEVINKLTEYKKKHYYLV